MNLNSRHLIVPAAILLLFVLAGCSGREITDLPQARANVDPVIFDDELSPDVYFQPFYETHYTAMEVDSVWAYDGYAPYGARSLKFNIPAAGSALGPYTGGVMTSVAARDLADFNALVFYARSDRDIRLNETGFGNDNTGTSLYAARRLNVSLGGDWTRVAVPIPAPSRLIAERGLFTVAEGVEEDFEAEGYNIWFDEIRFADLPNLTFVRTLMENWTRSFFVGSTITMGEGRSDYELNEEPIIIWHSPEYFDFVSSNPDVATVGQGVIKVVGSGEATITATLEDQTAYGAINITGMELPAAPADPPALPAENVISLFSDVYDDIPVESWRAEWSGSTQLEDFVVSGDNVKMYHSLDYVGVLFHEAEVDATSMTHLHLDVYAPGGRSGT